MKEKFYFYEGRVMGKPISSYGLSNGYMDYGCLANIVADRGGLILNNTIQSNTLDVGEWENYAGSLVYYYDENDDIRTEKEYYDNDCPDDWMECYTDVYQQYIISEEGANILRDYTNEVVEYNEALDIYLWDISHYGTSWSYVLTDIKINEMRNSI